MAINIKVSPDEVRKIAAEIQAKAEDYKTNYTDLYQKAEAMGANWTGKDNTAYINQINGFKDDLEKMRTLMLDYADYLRKAAQTYEETQNAIAQNATKLQN